MFISIFEAIFEVTFILLVTFAMILDLIYLRIPNIISICLALFFILFSIYSFNSSLLFLNFASFGLVLIVGFFLFYFNLFGGGDVKFMSVAALWIGLDKLPLFIVSVSIFGGFLAVILILLRLVPPRFFCGFQKMDGPIFPCLASGAPMPYGIAIGCGALFVRYLNEIKTFFLS